MTKVAQVSATLVSIYVCFCVRLCVRVYAFVLHGNQKYYLWNFYHPNLPQALSPQLGSKPV